MIFGAKGFEMTDTNITTMKPPIVVLREKLIARKDELRNALTDIDPDHFIRALVTAADANPELQACEWQSLWKACLKACSDNLLPDGREGVIVPYKNKATWIPMYRGLLKLFRQSGECKWITADVVRRGETFEYWVDQNGVHFKHVPQGDDSKLIERVYAAALTKDGAFYVAVLSMTEINKIKAVSKATREDSPWFRWTSEMMKKTALRRLAKLLPSGRDLFEEEDEQPPPPREEQAAVDHERPPWAASAALDQFAGGSSDAPAPTASEGDPAGEGPLPPAVPDAPQDALISDHYCIAYERGQIARASGAQRRAVPGEYRDENNRLESEAWHAGFDGKRWLNPETGEALGPEN
jgi:phage RecT family recombinase